MVKLTYRYISLVSLLVQKYKRWRWRARQGKGIPYEGNYATFLDKKTERMRQVYSQFTCFTSTKVPFSTRRTSACARYTLSLLALLVRKYVSRQEDRAHAPGKVVYSQFTCFTSTKVQMLDTSGHFFFLRASACARYTLSLLASLVRQYKCWHLRRFFLLRVMRRSRRGILGRS